MQTLEKKLQHRSISLHQLSKDRIHNKGVIALITSGGILLGTSYLLGSITLTFAGLGLVLWGTLFYIGRPSVTREDIAAFMPLSAIKALNRTISSLGYKGSGLFFYSRILNTETRAYLFVRANDNELSLPNEKEIVDGNIFCNTPNGISIPAPALGIMDFLEKELSTDFATYDLDLIQASLPKLLVEDLKLADALDMQYNLDKVFVKISSESWSNICNNISEECQVGGHALCPICGTFALIFSKVTGKTIAIVSNSVTANTIETVYSIIDN